MATILGIPFSTKTMAQTVSFLNHYLENETKPFHVVTANPEIVMQAKRNRRFRMLVKNADMVTPDGIGIVIGSKILKKDITERVTGFDLIQNLLQKREEEGKKTKIYMVGAKEHVIALAVSNIKEKFSLLDVVGYHHGYFQANSMDEESIVNDIASLKPDLVLVGLGSPRQEEFIATYKDKLNSKMFIGCGGTFDVLSGLVERAPSSFQRFHLEWAWRLAKEPKRFKRQLDIPRFLIEVLKERRRK